VNDEMNGFVGDLIKGKPSAMQVVYDYQ